MFGDVSWEICPLFSFSKYGNPNYAYFRFGINSNSSSMKLRMPNSFNKAEDHEFGLFVFKSKTKLLRQIQAAMHLANMMDS